MMHKTILSTRVLILLMATIPLHAQRTKHLFSFRDSRKPDSTAQAPLPDSPSPRIDFALPPNRGAGTIPELHVELAADHEYSLAELVDIAERENPETRVAWEGARNIAISEGVAASTYLPTITAHVLGGYQGAGGQNSSFGFSVKNSGNVAGSVEAVSLAWLLFDFGGRRNVVTATRRLGDASNIAFIGAHQRVIYAVSLAYYEYIAAVHRRKTAADCLANAEDIEAAAKVRYDQGQGTVIETAQARSLTAQANLSLVNAGGAEEQAYAALLAAMGVSPLASIRIAPVQHHPLSAEDLVSVDLIVKDALSRRPDVLAAYNTLQASEASVRAAEAQNRPKVFLTGTGAYVNGQLGITAVPPIGEQLPAANITGNQWNGTVLLGVSIPLYDAHRRGNAIRQAKNDQDKASATLDQVRLSAMREIVSAHIRLRTSVAANDAAAILKSAAQTSYDAALDSYRQGVGTLTGSVDAETQLFQARLAEDDAYTSALAAAATLAFATGELGSAPK